MANEQVPGYEQQSRADSAADAENEAAFISAGSYQEQAERNAFNRRERLLDVLSGGRVLLARVLPWAVILFIGVMGWHYVGPDKWGWLTPEQINRVESVLSGVGVSLVVVYLRRYL